MSFLIGLKFDKLSTTAGFTLTDEPFFRSLIKAANKFSVTHQLHKAQIQIPFNKGRTLLGVADETGQLQYGQVFFQYSENVRHKFPGPNSKKTVHKGKVLLTKNTCTVAGDVRMLEAVDIPELRHLVDVIVFPVHGNRSHPDEMAGSDLDGDEYSAIWDEQLFFDHNEAPFDFSVPKLEEEIINLQDKMATFYVNYLMNDDVGKISTAFLNAADMYGINHRTTLSLAKKTNQAVDFTKSGLTPEQLTTEWAKDPETNEEIPPERSERNPDFQMADNGRPNYQSSRILGKLTREIRSIEEIIKISENLEEQIPVEFDERVVGWHNYRDVATEQLSKYSSNVRSLMEAYGIRTEAELFSGCICEMKNRLSDKANDDMSFYNTNQLIETRMTNIFRKFREKFFEEFGGWRVATEPLDKSYTDEDNICHREVRCPTEAMMQKACAYYITCYHTARETGERILSFAWLAYDILAAIKQEIIIQDTDFSLGGNPLFELLDIQMEKYIGENADAFEEFRQFLPGPFVSSTITEPLIKYCKAYDGIMCFIVCVQQISGLDRLLFIVYEWANNLEMLTLRFSSHHLSLLVIMYLTKALPTDTRTVPLRQPIPVRSCVEELRPETFGNHAEVLLLFLEFLSSHQFVQLQNIDFSALGVSSLFCRGEWLPYHKAAQRTYYNMAYNLRFEELPLRAERAVIRKEIIREMEPITIELADPVDEIKLKRKLIQKTEVKEVELRKQKNNRAIVSARGTFSALEKLRCLLTTRLPKHLAASGKEAQKQFFALLYNNIMKEELTETDSISHL